MSMLPIGEALRRLEDEALVEAVPRVGTLVKTPTPQDIRGFYVVREALESQAARLFSEKATPTDRKELTALAKRLDAAYKKCAECEEVSAQQLYELRGEHMKFHLTVAEGAHCPFLRRAIEKNQVLIFNWFLDLLFGYPGLPQNWHEELAGVLTGTDLEAADRAMRKHVRFRMDELLVKLEPYYSLDRHHIARTISRFPSLPHTASVTSSL
jgi:DNA-binding GntR family transcriptional regulator